ncbi:pentapeptide repeat-containing protein [Rhodococcus sp. NPDC055112]
MKRTSKKRTRWPLRAWVGLGTAVTTGVGLSVLLVFARLQAGKAVWENGFYLNGSQWFDVARTTVTLIGIIGLGGAAFLAYRKQLSTEATHILQEAGALRNRYTTCAEQLGHDSPAIRQAGVYALASLADDWHIKGSDAERQVCIDLLCAYLRTDRAPSIAPATPGPSPTSRRTVAGRKPMRLTPNPPPPKSDPQEQEVRDAVISVIRDRTTTLSPEKRWPDGVLALRSANLRGADLRGAHLVRATLLEANLNGAHLDGAFLSGANLRGAHLARATLLEAVLNGAHLDSAFLSGAFLNGAHLDGAYLRGVDLTDADLTDVDLRGANLSGANLSGAFLSDADLRGANLRGANLRRAHLTDADLTDVDLRGANLSGAHMSGANLTDANLTGADLRGANLSANLSGANLSGANLSGANLLDAFLSGADLTDADLCVDLFGADLTEIHYSSSTKWPDGFSPPLPTPPGS